MISKVSSLIVTAALTLPALGAAAQTLSSTITLAAPPNQLAVDPLLNRVYITVPSPTGQNFDYVTVVNGKNDSILTNISIHQIATAIAVDTIRSLVYVGGTYTDPNSGITYNQIAQICAGRNKVLNYFTVSNTVNPEGGQISGIGVDLANGDIWVANGSDDEIDVVSRTGTVKRRISTSEAPTAVAVNPITGNAYVALTEPLAVGSAAPLLDVVNLKTYAVNSIPFGEAGTSNQGVAVDLTTGNVFVTNAPYTGLVGSVGVFNSAGVLQTTLTSGDNPQGVDTDPLTKRVYLANDGDDTISVISDATNPATINGPYGFSASWLAVNPVTSKVYLSSSTNDSPGNYVTVIHE